MSPEESAYHELCGYTLSHGSPAFVHQHVVDAWAAQTATPASKPIGVTFALVGLCLHLEHARTGREVQRAHMQLARDRRQWPRWPLPSDRAAITPADVIAAPPGPARDAAIDAWCAAVWSAYRDAAPGIRALVAQYALA